MIESSKKGTERITFVIPKDIKEKAQRRADREYKTLSEICRQTIYDYGRNEDPINDKQKAILAFLIAKQRENISDEELSKITQKFLKENNISDEEFLSTLNSYDRFFQMDEFLKHLEEVKNYIPIGREKDFVLFEKIYNTMKKKGLTDEQIRSKLGECLTFEDLKKLMEEYIGK